MKKVEIKTDSGAIISAEMLVFILMQLHFRLVNSCYGGIRVLS